METVELADLAISTNATELFVGESTEITIEYSPIYAIFDLSYIYESVLTIENGIVFAEKAGEYEISIIDTAPKTTLFTPISTHLLSNRYSSSSCRILTFVVRNCLYRNLR